MERPKPVPAPAEGMSAALPSAQAYGEQVMGRTPVPPPSPRPEIQIFPPIITADELMRKLRAPYAEGERQLRQRLKGLHPTVADETEADGVLSDTEDEACPVMYATGMGPCSFEALHDTTRSYVAAVLRRRYGLPFSRIDDALQGAYLRLLRRLKAAPDVYADKGKAYIATQLVFDGLHSLQADGRYHRHIQDSEGRSSTDTRGGHSSESRAVDLRLDVHQAIGQVAEAILTSGGRKHRIQLEVWALYGLTMQRVSAQEMSRLFGVRRQSMQAAYQRVAGWLREALPGYPRGAVRRSHWERGRSRLPQEDLAAVRRANRGASEAVYEAVQGRIVALQSDTQAQDLIALAGIRQGIAVTVQAQKHGLSAAKMQRAYNRVHLLIGSERDPTVRARRADRRMQYVFSLTPEKAAAVHQLALELLKAPKSYEKLVALHAHISNLAVSTTAKHFGIPTPTLRYYVQQIAAQLQTPQQSAPWQGIRKPSASS